MPEFKTLKLTLLAALPLLATGPLAAAAALGNPGPSYTLFESGQVRPLALSADHKTLFAVNTPNNRLEILDVSSDDGPRLLDEVVVGLEPVAVAVRNDSEVWVVNHLSDSISVVQLTGRHGPHVERTLLVGDEPRDIVFAGPGRSRAFVTTAHRGQNTGRDPQLFTAGVGRADVWVFDANNLGSTLGGTPLTVVTLFTDTPRALAVAPDGRTVYAAGLLTGNRTTSIFELAMPPGSLPGPRTNFQGHYQPQTGLIVKFNGSHWVDKQTEKIWDNQVMFNLPDKDVFAIDAMANPPTPITGKGGIFSGVGTVLFNMAVNPVSGKVYVSNTDAQNDTRFEGPGIFAEAPCAATRTRITFRFCRATALSRYGISISTSTTASVARQFQTRRTTGAWHFQQAWKLPPMAARFTWLRWAAARWESSILRNSSKTRSCLLLPTRFRYPAVGPRAWSWMKAGIAST